jgi:hypothetical protein
MCLPTSPFLTILSFPLDARVDVARTGVRGVPGDVGGRASGAELMECAARVCEYNLWGGDSGERVFVNVIVAENGSPAKYEDCKGVTTTQMAESMSQDLAPDISKMVQIKALQPENCNGLTISI